MHGASAAADAMIAVALAGSLFFDIDPDDARWRILLYLLFTAAPFAVVGPFIGPTLDRAPGGRRTAIMAIQGLRVLTALAMVPWITSVWLFPIAFAHLVLGKSYHVAKASIVPTTVNSEAELVDKNSRLAVLSGVAGFVGAAPAVIAQFVGGPRITLILAMITYFGAFVLARQLPPEKPTAGANPQAGAAEIRSRGILLSGTAMAVLRGIVGFMFWMVAFAFRGGVDDVDLSGTGSSVGSAVRTALGYPVIDESVTAAWKLGVILAFSAVGTLAGSFLAPRVRERVAEEDMLLGALASVLVTGILATWVGGLNGAGLLALVIGFGAAIAKVAFDAIVQRDAPDANYGASFARFETRFQIAWVIGALVPVVLRIPTRLGFFVIAAAAFFAGASYWVGSRAERYDDSRVTAVLARLGFGGGAQEVGAQGDADKPGSDEAARGSAHNPLPVAAMPGSGRDDDPTEPVYFDDGARETLAVPKWVGPAGGGDSAGPERSVFDTDS